MKRILFLIFTVFIAPGILFGGQFDSYDAKTTPANADLVIIKDSADGKTKKMTFQNFSAGIASPPGGNDTEVQFNNSGAFAGDSGMTYNSGTDTLSLGALSLTTDLAITEGGTGASDAATAFSNLKQDATDAATGVVELATDAEAATGTATDRAVTPANISSLGHISNVVEDTTPQLGGALDANGNNIQVGTADADTYISGPAADQFSVTAGGNEGVRVIEYNDGTASRTVTILNGTELASETNSTTNGTTTITDGDATWQTDGVAAGDYLIITAGGTAAAYGVYRITSVTNETTLVVDVAASGSNSDVSLVIIDSLATVIADDTNTKSTSYGFSALSGLTSSGINFTAFGYEALSGTSTGNYNAAFGQNALYACGATSQAAAFGNNASNGTEAGQTASLGFGALQSATGATKCCAVGAEALKSSSGSENVAFGFQSLYQSSGSQNTGIGSNSLTSLTGSKNVAVGVHSGRSSAADSSIYLGFWAGAYNNSDYIFSGGEYSAFRNSSANLTATGFESAYQNAGADSVFNGYQSGKYNQEDDNIAIGSNANSDFVDNAGGAIVFADTDVNATTDVITVTGHSFGSAGTYVHVRYDQGSGSAIGGLTDESIYKVYIVDANSVDFNYGVVATNITSAGSGADYDLTPQYDYTNTIVIGYDVEPTADNQVTLGNSSVTSSLIRGAIANAPVTYTYTTEADLDDPLTSSTYLLDGDNDGDNDACDLQDGTYSGQTLTIIAAVDVDADDTFTLNFGDTTATNAPAVVFDKIGENVTLIWTGATWVVTALQDSL